MPMRNVGSETPIRLRIMNTRDETALRRMPV